MAAAMLARALGATKVLGVDVSAPRLALALRLGLVDDAVSAGEGAVESIRAATNGDGCEVSIDCSGSPAGRLIALQGTRRWGRSAMVGEGNQIDFDVSQTIIHNQITIYGSWVTSIGRMEELVERLVRWGLRPEMIVTHRFPLESAAEAYRVADEGESGKVCLVMDMT
jgi:threonine dehydrogenase-like Zn-dependent dehydrogenase